MTQLQARGVFHARQVFLVTNGAEWIKNFGDHYLPHAVYLLDWYHLADNLRRARPSTSASGSRSRAGSHRTRLRPYPVARARRPPP